jgi:integrase
MKKEQFPINSNALFRDAAQQWLTTHTRYIGPRTLKDYKQYLIPLLYRYGSRKLKSITIQDIREYQEWRRVPHPEMYTLRTTGKAKPPCLLNRITGAGNAYINKEINTLSQVLTEAGVWRDIAPFYTQLPTSKEGSGKSLTADEEKIVLEIAMTRYRWKVAAHSLRIMFKTGCGFGELRKRKREDVDLEAGILTVTQEGAKNAYRRRTVPLIPEALESMRWLVARWERLGGNSPNQYILPMRIWRTAGYDLSKPMESIKRAWEEIRKESAKQIGPKMLKFRIYDARVTAITRTLSDGQTPLHAAQRVFGHVSQEMQKRYFKPDADLLRRTLSVLDTSAGRRVNAGEPASQPSGAVSVSGVIASLREAGLQSDQILDIIASMQAGKNGESSRGT